MPKVRKQSLIHQKKCLRNIYFVVMHNNFQAVLAKLDGLNTIGGNSYTESNCLENHWFSSFIQDESPIKYG